MISKKNKKKASNEAAKLEGNVYPDNNIHTYQDYINFSINMQRKSPQTPNWSGNSLINCVYPTSGFNSQLGRTLLFRRYL